MKNDSYDRRDISFFLHAVERGAKLKYVPSTKVKDENYGTAIVKAPSTKANSVVINEGTLEKVEDVEESSFAFKMNDYNLRKTKLPKGLLVDAGAISHIIRDTKEFKNYDQIFKPENHCMELADGTKTSGIALKRGDAEVCLLDENRVLDTLKKALHIHFYPLDIFSVKVATTNGPTDIFIENKNQLKHKSGTKFKIHAHKRLYQLMTTEDNKNTKDSCRGCYDIHTWYKILGHCNFDSFTVQQAQTYQ